MRKDKNLYIIFMLLMAFLAFYWANSNESWTVGGTIATASCFVLFVLLGLRTIPVLSAYILTGDRTDEIPVHRTDEGNRKQDWLRIIGWMLLSRCLLLIIGYVFLIIQHGYSGGLFSKMMETWHISGIDAFAYLGIAENGYVTEGDPRFHIVFFPLLPHLIRVIEVLTGSYLAAGFVVSIIFSIVAALFAYELARMDMSRRNAMRAVKYIFIFPAAFFFLIPMTESLFLALSLMCIYFVRNKKWIIGCLCGALAAYTRSPGILLAVPVAIELVRELIVYYKVSDKRVFIGKLATAVAGLLIIPLGLLAYLYINYEVTGNAFQYSIYQKEHWSQELYLFFDTVRYQMEYAVRAFTEGNSRFFLGLWLPNLVAIFTALIVMLLGVKKLNPSYTAYFIVYFVLVVGPTWLLSAPRYFIVAFPLAFATAALTEEKSKDAALTVLSIVGSLLYLALFVTGYPVY
jgi:Gpi18-like mannosyltransferase